MVPLAIEIRRCDRIGYVVAQMPTDATNLSWDVAHMRAQQRVMESDRLYRHPMYLIAKDDDGRLVEFESKPTDGSFLQDWE